MSRIFFFGPIRPLLCISICINVTVGLSYSHCLAIIKNLIEYLIQRRMLDFVSPDSGFEREHEVKRLLKTPSEVKDSNGGAPKAQTKKGMRLKTKSSKEKKVGRTRIYSDEAREAIAKMALNEGDRKAADHYTKEFGHSVNRSTVNSFKRAYMKNRNKNGGKGSVELQNPVSQDETADLNNMKVQDKEVYSGDEDKEVGGNLDKKVGGNQDKEVGGNAILDQVSAPY